ncbi:hypothetical protein BDN70DRAFT_931810 [Pholiota conissans]|uniref:Uncharacterized protein n=1 Tax=Pholiota conissans TaxID=109636 RepID=A0A9P5Z5C8_9AGAR|nr:hypothetical protein BDN70DRAFT_931810 [Pholiota conissans]
MPRKADKFPFSRNFTGRNFGITRWKKERAQAHLDKPLFNELDPSRTRAKWQEAIMRFYGNHFNNHIKNDKPTIPVTTEEVSEGGIDPKNRKIALPLLSAGIPPKTLFSLERDEEISALAKVSHSGAPRDGKSTIGKRKRASKSDASVAVEKSTSLWRGGRERQVPPSGPTLVADPSRPPVKHSKSKWGPRWVEVPESPQAQAVI